MAKNEKSSAALASLAAGVLSGNIKPTQQQIAKLAGSVLTQAPNKKK